MKVNKLYLKGAEPQQQASIANAFLVDAIEGETLERRQQGRRRMLRYLEMLRDSGAKEATGKTRRVMLKVIEHVEGHLEAAVAAAVESGDVTQPEADQWRDVVEAFAEELKGGNVIVTKLGPGDGGDEDYQIARW